MKWFFCCQENAIFQPLIGKLSTWGKMALNPKGINDAIEAVCGMKHIPSWKKMLRNTLRILSSCTMRISQTRSTMETMRATTKTALAIFRILLIHEISSARLNFAERVFTLLFVCFQHRSYCLARNLYFRETFIWLAGLLLQHVFSAVLLIRHLQSSISPSSIVSSLQEPRFKKTNTQHNM